MQTVTPPAAACRGWSSPRRPVSCAAEDGHPGRHDALSHERYPPDHLAIDARSPFHDADALSRGVGVRFNGIERDNVEEYSISEGWIKVQAGKARDRRGNPMTMKVKGEVVAYYLDTKSDAKPAAE